MVHIDKINVVLIATHRRVAVAHCRWHGRCHCPCKPAAAEPCPTPVGGDTKQERKGRGRLRAARQRRDAHHGPAKLGAPGRRAAGCDHGGAVCCRRLSVRACEIQRPLHHPDSVRFCPDSSTSGLLFSARRPVGCCVRASPRFVAQDTKAYKAPALLNVKGLPALARAVLALLPVPCFATR